MKDNIARWWICVDKNGRRFVEERDGKAVMTTRPSLEAHMSRNFARRVAKAHDLEVRYVFVADYDDEETDGAG